MASVGLATKFFSQPKEGFATTVGTTFAAGAAVVTFAGLSGYNDGDLVVLVIDPATPASKDVVVGTKSGNTLTGCIWTEGPATGHNAGVTVVDYVTATHWALLSKGLLVQHNIDGTHSNITASTLSTTGLITDQGTSLLQLRQDTVSNYVASGGVIAQTAGLIASFSDAAFYYNGTRLTKTGVANRTYTASKDTYVDLSNTGVLTYIEVANGATTGFALTANSIRIAKVVTGAAAITSVQQYGRDAMNVAIYPNGAVSGAQLNSNALAANIKSGSNSSAITVVNGDNNFASNGVAATFTTAGPCIAFATINLGIFATGGDFEEQPIIYLDGVQVAKATPSANVGNASGRTYMRSFAWTVPITAAGVHTISAGVTISSGSGLGCPAFACNITAIVLGNVTA